jgi:tetratricopeptide (TPR) repeat protein
MKADELIQLIHSLDERETRLYKRLAGQHLRHGKTNYLSLFNALAAMNSYDPDALAKKIRNPELLQHLPTHITRLFDHITDFLREVNQYPTVEVQLNAASERVAILVERGLYNSARKELRKAQKLATQHGSHLQLLRLADLERAFIFYDGALTGGLPAQIQQFHDRAYLHALHEEVDVKLAHFEIKYLAKTRTGSPGAVQPLLKRLGGKSVMKTIQRAQASASDLMLLDAIGMCAQVEGNFDQAYAAYTRMDSLWVSNPTKIAENAQLYIGFTTSFLNSCLVLGRHNEFRNLLANLKTVQFANEMHALRLKEGLLYLELLFCLNRFEYDKGIALGPEIEAMLQQKKGRISGARTITFHFNLGSLHFLKGEYRKANRWLAQIINFPEQQYRKDVQAFLPVFQLLLFIAMDDRELLAVRLRARLRQQPVEGMNRLEAAIVRLARKFLGEVEGTFLEAVAAFREEMLAIINEGVAAVGAGECLFWAEGRIKGKLPGEVLREYSQGYNG